MFILREEQVAQTCFFDDNMSERYDRLLVVKLMPCRLTKSVCTGYGSATSVIPKLIQFTSVHVILDFFYRPLWHLVSVHAQVV